MEALQFVTSTQQIRPKPVLAYNRSVEAHPNQKHVLARQSAAVCAVAGSAIIGGAIPWAPPTFWVATALMTSVIATTAYMVRSLFCDKSGAVEPNYSGARPPFAKRAAIGAGLGMAAAASVCVDAFYFDPFVRSKPFDFGVAMSAIIVASSVTALAVYALSGVLYVPTRREKKEEALLSGLLVMLGICWFQTVYDAAKKHPLQEAILTSTWTVGVFSLAMWVGMSLYFRWVPAEYRLVFRLIRSNPTK
jgi:hypothetical protein